MFLPQKSAYVKCLFPISRLYQLWEIQHCSLFQWMNQRLQLNYRNFQRDGCHAHNLLIPKRLRFDFRPLWEVCSRRMWVSEWMVSVPGVSLPLTQWWPGRASFLRDMKVGKKKKHSSLDEAKACGMVCYGLKSPKLYGLNQRRFVTFSSRLDGKNQYKKSCKCIYVCV